MCANTLCVYLKGNCVWAVTGTIVTPVIGFVEQEVDLSTLNVSKDEVDQVFIRSLEDLMNPTLQ